MTTITFWKSGIEVKKCYSCSATISPWSDCYKLEEKNKYISFACTSCGKKKAEELKTNEWLLSHCAQCRKKSSLYHYIYNRSTKKLTQSTSNATDANNQIVFCTKEHCFQFFRELAQNKKRKEQAKLGKIKVKEEKLRREFLLKLVESIGKGYDVSEYINSCEWDEEEKEILLAAVEAKQEEINQNKRNQTKDDQEKLRKSKEELKRVQRKDQTEPSESNDDNQSEPENKPPTSSFFPINNNSERKCASCQKDLSSTEKTLNYLTEEPNYRFCGGCYPEAQEYYWINWKIRRGHSVSEEDIGNNSKLSEGNKLILKAFVRARKGEEADIDSLPLPEEKKQELRKIYQKAKAKKVSKKYNFKCKDCKKTHEDDYNWSFCYHCHSNNIETFQNGIKITDGNKNNKPGRAGLYIGCGIVGLFFILLIIILTKNRKRKKF